MVRNLFNLLAKRQSNILSGATILMLTVFASKFLGLIRDRLLVHNFDTSSASIFFAAFRLPDLLFQLLIFGALSVAFIPVFTDHLSKYGEGEAFDFAENILNVSLVLFSVVVLLAFIFVSNLNSLVVPGFSGVQKMETDMLTRVILLGQILLLIGAFFIGIAQSFQRFIIPALAPLLYNLGIIIGILFLTPVFGITGPALGVIIGAALHVLVQLPLINSLGYKFKLSVNFFDSGVKEIIKLISIRNIGLVVEQVSETVGIALASIISYSSVTLLTFAQHLQVVPIGLFGATIAQATLPVLSREKALGEIDSFKITLLTTMHQILFLTLPSAAILIILRIPVVRLTFGASQFNWVDTVLTGRTLAFLSLGLVAQSVSLLLVRGFYALKDARTPVVISIITVFLNIVLSFLFIKGFKWDVWSLGLAYSIPANVSIILLVYFLNKKVGGFNLNNLLIPALKMILAATVAAIALYIPIKGLDKLVFDTTRTVNLIILTGIASIFGIFVYLLLVWLMEVEELNTFVKLTRDVLGKFKGLNNVRSKIQSDEIIKETGEI